MTSQRITEELTIEHDQHRVFACVWHSGQLVARERIPRQYVDPKCKPELAEEYLKGVCVRLMARIPKPTVKEDNGQVINLKTAGSIQTSSN